MIFAALTFYNLGWLWPLAGLIGFGLLVLVWSYKANRGVRFRGLCAVLKAVGMLLLASCLLEPLWSGQRARPGANLFVLVADNSQSLQVKDRSADTTRGQQLRRLLDPDRSPWVRQLEANFELRRFFFDSQLQATRDFHELDFQGRASALGQALEGLKERLRGRPVAGVMVFTDGNSTDELQASDSWRELPPVYPVLLGRPGAVRDAAVGQVQVTQTAFEDAPVTVRADVHAQGFRGRTLIARLQDEAGRTVAEEKRRVRKATDNVNFEFHFTPDKPGLSFYALEVGTPQVLEAGGETQSSDEATFLNNRRVVVVDRGAGPYRILYVAGRPNWEYKFLARALQEDPQLQLVALIRVARREPKFEFRGRAGETGNPLFRGFGDQSREAVERYDQPVLIRLNTRDAAELQGGFPQSPELLYPYHAIILDDLEAAFFNADQKLLVQRFVSERGGGLLMLGGMECFREGDYARTPIGDLLPVYLDPVSLPEPPGLVRFDLTREGWLQPWARLRDNEAAERQRLEAMPWFQVYNPVGEVKPGASLIATITDERGQRHPALATQRFGRGRVAALMIGDVWRWGMRSPEARADMNKAWRQLLRWLVADVPARVELAVESANDQAPNAVRLAVRVRDETFQPLDTAEVTLEVQPTLHMAARPAPPSVRLRAEPSLDEAGLYVATYLPRATGGYRVTAYVTNTVGAEVGRAVAGWSTDLAAAEFRSLTPDRSLLERLARTTGGEVVSPDRLSALVDDLPLRKAPVMETWTRPAWHTPVVFGLALACLLMEWGLRRSHGMP